MSAGLRSAAGRLGELAELSLDVLPAMRDAESGLFSHKTLSRDGAYVNQGTNVLYTTVSLVGILSQTRRPPDSVLELGAAMDAAYAAVARRGVPGELANMVWADALAGDGRGAGLLARLAETEPRLCPSGELGQVLYGLVAGAGAYPAGRDAAMAAAAACAEELLRRYNPGAGVFRASPRRFPPRRELLEARFAHFAAQVYPLHGLAAHCLATGEEPPPALRGVAERIVAAQGPLGQWWWLYSCRARVVVEGYPVYSVHQDGMAFLGLARLGELGVGDFGEALARGLEWLDGKNELGAALAGGEPPLIPRCIMRAGSDADAPYGISRANFAATVGRSLLPRAGGDRTAAEPGRLEVLRECRSYHLGWLLYADSLLQAATTGGADGGR